jgi:hypothetical protein
MILSYYPYENEDMADSRMHTGPSPDTPTNNRCLKQGIFNYADDLSRMSKTVRLFKTLAQNPHVPVDDIVY